MSGWPVCGNCGEVAFFGWLGGMHACHADPFVEPLTVRLERPRPAIDCGSRHQRAIKCIVIEGAELAHLERFMERVQDDDEVTRLSVTVCADGTLEFRGAGFIYSARIGIDEPLPGWP